MTIKQKTLILKWVALFLLFASPIIFEKWIGDNSEIIRKGFMLVFIILAIAGDPFKSKEPFNIQEIVDNHPWIKLYLVLFGLGIIVNALLGTLGKIASEGSIFGALIIPLFILSLPFIVVTQRKQYIEAGKKFKT